MDVPVLKHVTVIKIFQVSLLILVTVAIFVNTLQNDFIWDDSFLIETNDYIRDLKNVPYFFTPGYWNAHHPFAGQYRPLRTVSLALDYHFWQTVPAGYRATNLLLHLINVILVFCLVAVLAGEGGGGRKEPPGLPFATALLFAAHPIHIESLNLVKNRSDLLALLFFLLSLLLYVNHYKARGRTTARLALIGGWMLFIPAILAKEMALTLPGVLVLYTLCFLPKTAWKGALARIVPYAVVVAAYFIFLEAFIRPAAPLPAGVPVPMGPVQAVLTVIKTAGIYFKMLAVPYPLNAEHPFRLPVSVGEPAVVLSLLVLLMAGAGTVVSGRRRPLVCFALGWTMLTLLPAVNVVYLVSRPIAEQRLYIPSLGFCLLLAVGLLGLSRAMNRPREKGRAVTAGLLPVLVVVLLYAGLTVRRNREWRDDITFYSAAIAANPTSARMHNNLGIALNRIEQYDKAIDHYRTALRLDPANAKAHFNLGLTLYRTGQYEQAVDHYRTGLDLTRNKADPALVGVYTNWGAALIRTGENDRAVSVLRRALAIDPENTDAWYNLGEALTAGQNYPEALKAFSRVLEIEPGHERAGREYDRCRAMIRLISGLSDGKSSGR